MIYIPSVKDSTNKSDSLVILQGSLAMEFRSVVGADYINFLINSWGPHGLYGLILNKPAELVAVAKIMLRGTGSVVVQDPEKG